MVHVGVVVVVDDDDDDDDVVVVVCVVNVRFHNLCGNGIGVGFGVGG